MPEVNLTAKEIHIIVQAIRISMNVNDPNLGEYLQEYAKKPEIEMLRNKLQSVKDL